MSKSLAFVPPGFLHRRSEPRCSYTCANPNLDHLERNSRHTGFRTNSERWCQRYRKIQSFALQNQVLNWGGYICRECPRLVGVVHSECRFVVALDMYWCFAQACRGGFADEVAFLGIHDDAVDYTIGCIPLSNRFVADHQKYIVGYVIRAIFWKVNDADRELPKLLVS